MTMTFWLERYLIIFLNAMTDDNDDDGGDNDNDNNYDDDDDSKNNIDGHTAF